MRCLSTHTELPDPFEAGLALGKHLADLIPDVILVFASSRHQEWTEIHEGLVFGLGRSDVRIIGCCSDGVYARSGVYDLGISALAFHLGASVRMNITSVRNTGSLGRQAGQIAATANLTTLADPSLAIAVFDGITCDGALIAEGLSTMPCPVVGGMATDSVRNEFSRVFLDGEMMDDAFGSTGEL